MNEQTDERVAQYLRLDSCLFQATVDPCAKYALASPTTDAPDYNYDDYDEFGNSQEGKYSHNRNGWS